jgi:hypothetical protein
MRRSRFLDYWGLHKNTASYYWAGYERCNRHARNLFCIQWASSVAAVKGSKESNVQWNAGCCVEMAFWAGEGSPPRRKLEEAELCKRESLWWSCRMRQVFDRAKKLQPKSLRVACYASSWCTYQEKTNDGRRSGNIFIGSIIQALVNRIDGLEGDGDQIRELGTPRSQLDFHSMAFHVSFWFVLGLFESIPHPLCVSGRTPEERISLPHALVLPCSREITVPVADPVRVNPASSVCIILLGSSLRETMCLHACAHTTSCTF